MEDMEKIHKIDPELYYELKRIDYCRERGLIHGWMVH
jgi:hypothetical protein